MGIKILKTKNITSEDSDGYNVLLHVIKASKGEEQIKDEINSRCTHSYDCCANWYSSVRRIIKTKSPDIYIVLVSNVQNI